MVGYEVRLKNPEGSLIDIIDDWISLKYTPVVNDVGALQLVLDGNYSPFDNLRLDGIIEVVRRVGGRTYIDAETVWLIREVTRQLTGSGERFITIGAVSAIELLSRRLIAFDAGTPQASKSDKADSMMKAFVSENAGTDADTDRQIENFTVESSASNGPNIEMEADWVNLLDTLQDISQAAIVAGSAIYFDVVAPVPGGLFEFRTYEGLRGNDNTFPGGTNPVILSPARGNLVNVTRTYDWSGEVTVSYAGGAGIGAGREVQSASSVRLEDSPYNRRESFAQGGGTGGASAILDAARTALRKGRPKRSFRGQLVNVTGQTEYGVHWQVGDKVTAQFEGESIDCFIDSVTIAVSDGRETIQGNLRAEEE